MSTQASPPREPNSEVFQNALVRYVAATRPAFVSVTVFAVLLGLACAYRDRYPIDPLTAALTLVFAMVAHAGVNVVNDYFDALSGTDDANLDRVFPFTGGSRFIQNGVLTRQQTWRYGHALLLAVIPAGLLLTWWSGPGLLVIGTAGLFIGWAYSAEPLKLNSRGLGEPCVAAGILCVVLGADYVQRKVYALTPFSAGIPFALLALNILFINQFPDRKADIGAGKLHWVARLEPDVAAWGYALIAAASAVLLTTSVLVRGCLPPLALLALLAYLPAAFAAAQLVRYASTPSRLAPAIKATILAALLHAGLLGTALFASR
jgi:1,4-dihydroxy-2-naphthoate octaprenyltransferase